MNPTPTSKRSDNKVGYYACAGSLLLHAGVIALIASWQWELKAPEKKQSKIIHVRFISPPQNPMTPETQKPAKFASTLPAQPLTLHSTEISKLIHRPPDVAMPTVQPAHAAHRMPSMTHTPQRRQRIRQTSLRKKMLPPAAARPLQVGSIRRGSSQGLEIRPLPVFEDHLAPSALLKTKTHSPLHSAPADIHPQTRASSVQPAPEKPISPESVGAQVAALTIQVNPNAPDVENEGSPDLGILRGTFVGNVRQRIVNAQNYPRIARHRGMEGQPVIAFTLDKRGRLTKVDVAQTSGYRLLDQAALKAVQKAAPYPEIPAQLKVDSFQFKLPVSFVLK